MSAGILACLDPMSDFLGNVFDPLTYFLQSNDLYKYLKKIED
jgi:hypothetical protein